MLDRLCTRLRYMLGFGYIPQPILDEEAVGETAEQILARHGINMTREEIASISISRNWALVRRDDLHRFLSQVAHDQAQLSLAYDKLAKFRTDDGHAAAAALSGARQAMGHCIGSEDE